MSGPARSSRETRKKAARPKDALPARERKEQRSPAADRRDPGAQVGKDDKRKQILKAASKVFAEKGYHGARISDVAEEASVAYGLVYHYFGNKEGLLRSIFETNWSVFAKAIEEIAAADASTREKLRQIVDFIVNAFEMTPLVVKVLVLEFGRSSRLGDALDEPEVNRVFRAVQTIFKEAAKSGELDEKTDPWALSVLFLGALESALASFVLPTPGEGEHSIAGNLAAMRESLLATFTRGLFVEAKAAAKPGPQSARGRARGA